MYICIDQHNMLELILLKSIVISLACVGLRIASSKGMLLYFLRMPYEWLTDKTKKEKFSYNMQATNARGLEVRILIMSRIKKLSIPIYILKPIIGCVTCMASVYTLLIEHFYFGNIDKWTILIIFIVACLNSIIYAFYEKLT